MGVLAPLGLRQKIVELAGAVVIIKEIEAGVSVATGAVTGPTPGNGPYGAYAPSVACDGANDYAIYYEAEPVI